MQSVIADSTKRAEVYATTIDTLCLRKELVEGYHILVVYVFHTRTLATEERDLGQHGIIYLTGTGRQVIVEVLCKNIAEEDTLFQWSLIALQQVLHL